MTFSRSASPLALARLAAGLTQDAAAARLGLRGGKMALSPYETGRTLVGPALLVRIGRLYKLSDMEAMGKCVATFKGGLTLSRYRAMAKKALDRNGK